MSSEHSINFHSLNVVRDELIATIEQAARDLEEFVSRESESRETLGSSVRGIQQIIGILQLLELGSAAMLAEELLAAAREIDLKAAGPNYEKRIETISNTFFILTRYLEYLHQVKVQVPALLIPHINALRKSRQETPLQESHFVKVPKPHDLPKVSFGRAASAANSGLSGLRRIRHMYHLGLMGFINERQVGNSLALMERAAKRVLSVTGSEVPIAKLWMMAVCALSVMRLRSMSPLETRKFLFMRLDGVFRQMEKLGEKAFSAAPPAGLVKELLYLIVLSGEKSELTKPYLAAVGNFSLPYSEKLLQREYMALYGPSAHTIGALSRVLQQELASVKRTLENASQSATSLIDDVADFKRILTNIAEILSVVGLNAASRNLKKEVDLVARWERDQSAIPPEEMASLANNILYLESVVQDLAGAQRVEPADNENNDTHDQEHMDNRVLSYELRTAIKIVIEECQAGLALTKRALNSFSDSNFDTAHIRNIGKTLTSIRGAMQLLRHDRAAEILACSVQFVEGVLFESELPATINEILETFADLIIAVEYYFDSAQADGSMDEQILMVADMSLKALGF